MARVANIIILNQTWEFCNWRLLNNTLGTDIHFLGNMCLQNGIYNGQKQLWSHQYVS